MEEYTGNENDNGNYPAYAIDAQAPAEAPEAYDPSMQMDQQQGMLGGYNPEDAAEEDSFLGFSEAKPKDGMSALFNKVLNLPNTTRVGNVDKQELGDMGISVREGLRIALLGHTFGHPLFANFFTQQAGIVTESSMAKRGWFQELFVSQKRFTEKSMGPGSGSSPGSQANLLPEQKQNKLEKYFLGKK